MLILGRIGLLGVAATLLCGCEASQLYLAYQTNVGINASINPDTSEGHLLIGYRRDFGAIVPKSVKLDGTGGTTGRRDAMAALACSDLIVDGIFLNKYVEYVATGQAAQSFAANLKNGSAQVDDFFDCYRRPPAPAGGGS